jgi:flavorubredoxin
MTIANPQSGTRVDEIEERIYRISTPVTKLPGGFSFNQYLIEDDEPLPFHTGPRKLFPFVRDAIGRVVPIERLRYIAFSHFEADECGSLNEFLAAAAGAVPLCGKVAALVSVNDMPDREARPIADGEVVSLGRRVVQWFDTPHMPHAWECGVLLNGRRAHCCAATCSPRAAPITPPSPRRTFSSRASVFVRRWTTTRTQKTGGRS